MVYCPHKSETNCYGTMQLFLMAAWFSLSRSRIPSLLGGGLRNIVPLAC